MPRSCTMRLQFYQNPSSTPSNWGFKSDQVTEEFPCRLWPWPGLSFFEPCLQAEPEFFVTGDVMVVFFLWVVELTRVMRKIPHFGVGIVWGTIPSGLPVFWIIVPGCSRNSYGTSPNLWAQKKLVKFWRGTHDTWLCFAKFLREFLGYSPFDLLRDLGDVILSWFRVK